MKKGCEHDYKLCMKHFFAYKKLQTIWWGENYLTTLGQWKSIVPEIMHKIRTLTSVIINLSQLLISLCRWKHLNKGGFISSTWNFVFPKVHCLFLLMIWALHAHTNWPVVTEHEWLAVLPFCLWEVESAPEHSSYFLIFHFNSNF